MSDTDGLTFAPLGWIYHDAWKWRESKTLLDHDDQGNVVPVDASKTLYNRGHCHLFLPGVDFSKSGSQQMYWGRQTYRFSVVDEWGPNSKDPLKNQSVRLVGKPVWYFRIEEYWRRMYIQPWDAVDMSCELPLNQTELYRKHSWTSWLRGLIESNSLASSAAEIDPDAVFADGGPSRSSVGYSDYLQAVRRRAARSLFVATRMEAYTAWYKARVDQSASEPSLDDQYVIAYVRHQEQVPDESDPSAPQSSYTLEAEFEDFFTSNAARYDGYVDDDAAMEAFLAWRGVETEPAGSKRDADGNIHVPTGERTGHVGIKYDASRPCHSLGPFREGGEFYFFNTVVNRTMPCEYWLDAERRVRRYYLKRKSEGVETAGGQTWTFGGDSSRFHWVSDGFDTAGPSLGRTYEPDGWTDGDYGYSQHRIPDIFGGTGYVFDGMNAKRLRTDRHFDASSVRRLVATNQQDGIAGGSGSMPEEKWKWVGDNSTMVANQYDEEGYALEVNSRDDSDPTSPPGHYEEGVGWVDDPEPEREPWTESSNAVHWEKRRWTGYYEQGELVKCPADGRWYRRDWAPYGYRPGGEMGEGNEWPSQPFWSRQKRKWFPNPSPWLCDGSPTDPAEASARTPYPTAGKPGAAARAVACPFQSAEENRLHLLRWEYALYYGLVWSYGQDGSPVKTAGSWESALEGYFSENGRFPDAAEEDALFAEWLSAVSPGLAEEYQDGDVYYDESLAPIPEDRIDQASRRYIASVVEPPGGEGEPEYVYRDLPDPVYTVKGYSCVAATDAGGSPVLLWYNANDTRTYLSFDEFRSVWRPLDDDETRALGLEGDMPRRNDVPYRTFREEDGTVADYFLGEDDGEGGTREFDPDSWPWIDGEREFKLGKYMSAEDDGKPDGTVPSINASSLDESAKSCVQTAFFPRVDAETRAENESRAKNQLTQFPLSPLDEAGLIDPYSPLDPYRNGSVDPILNWKKYFTHREEFTIPETTTVLGDGSVSNPKSTPNAPLPHPRETSYSREDGARRMYPDDMFVTPIIEYQRVVRTNSSTNLEGYMRLAGKEREAASMGMFVQVQGADGSKYDKSGAWKTDQEGNWGDGFEVSVSIPYRINGVVQSPFSDDARRVVPPGEYCHSCVKEEDKMRYHVEFYDSLEQIWRYDFPNYVNIIRAFQRRHMPQGADPDDHSLSYYQEDFNDHEAALKYRKDERAEHVPDGCSCWQDALDAYWTEIDSARHYSDNPVVRGMDCGYGPDGQVEVEENAFTELDDGSVMWRERTTYMMPTIDKVPYMRVDGRNVPGYLDSKGNRVKGGKVVEWNDPFKGDRDGKWVEQCLGAVVRAKCYLVLEDALGYRWIEEVSDTAMTPDDPIRGSDYDAP